MGFAQRGEGREAAAGLRGVDELCASPAGRPSVQKETGCEGGPNRRAAVTLSSQRATVPGQPATLPPRRCYSPKNREGWSAELAQLGHTASIKQEGWPRQGALPAPYRPPQACELLSLLANRSQERRALWGNLCAHGPSLAWNLPMSAPLLDLVAGRDETCPHGKLWPKGKAF